MNFLEKKIKMAGGSIQKRGCRCWLPLGSKKKVCIHNKKIILSFYVYIYTYLYDIADLFPGGCLLGCGFLLGGFRRG